MKIFKLLVLGVALLAYSSSVFGQSADFYKQQIEVCLSKGDCDKAQIMYDSWKELSGTRDNTIETRIAACKSVKRQEEPQRTQQQQAQVKPAIPIPVVGQEYSVRKDGYVITGRVAYLDATKQHGLLLVDKSTGTRRFSGSIYDSFRRLPTKAELELILKNKHLLGLYDEYWSQTADGKYHHYTLNFSDGKSYSRRTDNRNGWGEPNYYYCNEILIADF